MPKYRIPVEYTFKGYYDIVADNRYDAFQKVDQCGLVLGGHPHTTLNEDELVDWEIKTHPIKKIGKPEKQA